MREWNWPEHFAAQPDTLRYLNYVADKFDLRKDIQFESRVTAAHFDDAASDWTITLESRMPGYYGGAVKYREISQLVAAKSYQEFVFGQTKRAWTAGGEHDRTTTTGNRLIITGIVWPSPMKSPSGPTDHENASGTEPVELVRDTRMLPGPRYIEFSGYSPAPVEGSRCPSAWGSQMDGTDTEGHAARNYDLATTASPRRMLRHSRHGARPWPIWA